MTKKDIRKVEKIVEKVIHNIIDDPEGLTLEGYEGTSFSLAVLEEMEHYLGHSIDFMGIT